MVGRVIILIVVVLIAAVFPVHAFTSAGIKPGYSALILNAHKGTDTTYLKLGLDFGVTYTVGLQGYYVYTGNDVNYLDLGVKLRLTELTDFNLAGKLGLFKSTSSPDWQTSLGILADKSISSFTKVIVGADVLIKDWASWAYSLGLEYTFTQTTSLQVGLRRDFWSDTGEIAQLVFGLKTIF